MDITITAPTNDESNLVEHLLWKVLWKPLGLPKDIKQSFILDGNALVLLAKNHDESCGVIVAFQIAEREYELRHIAVQKSYQNEGIGRKMIYQLERRLIGMGIKTIRTIARNTSLGFFKTLGYKKTRDYPDHPVFKEHGITFSLMKKTIV